MSGVWGLVAAIALLWPDRVVSPFDGIPLDRPAEAMLVGLVFPTLWWLHRDFLRTRRARALVVLLLAWRAVSAAAFVQDGWCVRFTPARPYVWNQTGAPHAWDFRADWRAADPQCSAIMTRAYGEFHEFPVWFFNLPPPTDGWPVPLDRPPEATLRMTVHGFLNAPAPGRLRLDTGPGVAATMSVDAEARGLETSVGAGSHAVTLEATLTGTRWRLVPTWNDGDLFSSRLATTRRPARVDLVGRGWLAWIPTLLAGTLLVAWLAAALALVRSPVVWAWTAGASLAIGGLVVADRVNLARWAVAALVAAVWLPVPRRLRNGRGAFLLVGVPWIAFVAASAAPAIGRFVLYEWGHDFWMFQRYAYQIVMQGQWLEGGSPTFWFQPLYRWIAALLHVAFGDSSVGEWFWDGGCLLAGAMFSYHATRAFAGFRWALAAAVAPLAVFIIGTPRDLIGRGLGEISSAGLVYLAALLAMRSRHGRLAAAAAAGALATLAFYARLNNLPMAFGVAVFALPPRLPAAALARVRDWMPRTSWTTAVVVTASVAAGVVLFAWRTWYYTGVFSVFYGTQRQLLALWQPGTPPGTYLARAAASVAMVLSVNDPPQFAWLALPVAGGAAICALAIAGVPRLRTIPLPIVLFFAASIAGALVARGSAYPGRFSVHVIPVTSAAFVCGLAALVPRRSPAPRSTVACAA